jgi:hypothetical protein
MTKVELLLLFIVIYKKQLCKTGNSYKVSMKRGGQVMTGSNDPPLCVMKTGLIVRVLSLKHEMK